MTDPSTKPSRFAALLTVLCIMTLPYEFLRVFSGIPDFDDQGTLMITMRDLLNGGRLYDDVYALYGPFYYLTIGKLFTALHLPLTHDVGRAITLGFNIGCCLLLAALTFRVCRSVGGGLFTFFASAFLLQGMTLSPLHPQDIALTMVIGLAHLALSIEQAGEAGRPTRLPLMIVGGFLAALLLTKINIGLFAAAAIAIAALRATAGGRLVGVGERLAAAGAVVMPLALMQPLLHLTWVVGYCAVATATILACLAVCLRAEVPRRFGARDWIACLAALTVTMAVTLGLTLRGGTTPFAILNAVVLQNAHFIRNWYIELPLNGWSVAAARGAAGFALVAGRDGASRTRRSASVLALLKLTVGLGGMVAILLMATRVLPWSKADLFQLLAPFAFLVAMPGRRQVGFGRTSYALLSAMLVLYPFPVAGPQNNIAAALIIGALPVFLLEGVASLADLHASVRRAPRWSLRLAKVVTLLVCVSSLALQSRQAWWTWAGRPNSDLRGSTLIHVTPEEWAETHWILQQIQGCSSVYTLPGFMSLYFWTERPSPTALNNNDSLGLLSEQQQDAIVHDLASRPGLCVVENVHMLKVFDRGQLEARPPLLRYVQDTFEVAQSRGDFRILKRGAERAP
ncbi:MAG: hypothetical protein NVSMB18_11200 [Acetobacteraceae bacterium]